MKVVVGIPTLNEADSIGNVAKMVDQGLTELFDASHCLILNADSGSIDSTREIFLNTSTKCRKESLLEVNPHGKGCNVLAFLNHSSSEKADVIAMVDADVTSIDKDWIKKLIGPVVSDGADFVSPIYRRSKFEGSTTIHFARPSLYGIFGKMISQPIGGEFALSRQFKNYLREQEASLSARSYGIDIWLSCHALLSNGKTAQVKLDEKHHKPSYSKMRSMFPEVASSLSQILMNHKRPVESDSDQIAHAPSFLEAELRISESKIVSLRESGFEDLSFLANHDRELAEDVYQSPISRTKYFASCPTEEWAKQLSVFLGRAINGEQVETESNVLWPLFARRAASFWEEVSCVSSTDAELLVINQAQVVRSLLRHHLRQR